MQTICRRSSYSFPAFYGGFALRRPMNCYQNSFVATRKLWAPPPASRGGVYTCAARGLLHTEGKNLHSRIFPRVILIPEISDDEGEAALTLDVTYEVVTEIFSCHLRHGIFRERKLSHVWLRLPRTFKTYRVVKILVELFLVLFPMFWYRRQVTKTFKKVK